jgi:DNA-binding transcriptional ArsR family regulator
VAESRITELDPDRCGVRCLDVAKVRATQARLIDVGGATRAAAMFRLLGDPSRVRLLFALLEAGEMCVCDLAACVEAPETNVSQSLRSLRIAGVVRNRRAGRIIYYSLDDAHVRMLLDLSREHISHPTGLI